MCVQNLDDSRGLAIRITYRISLRSSSLWEPRHPSLKVVCHFSMLEALARREAHASLSPIQLFGSSPLIGWKTGTATGLRQRASSLLGLGHFAEW